MLPTGGERPPAGGAFLWLLPAADGAPPSLEQVGRTYVERLLAHFEGHRGMAAEAMGVSYPTFLKRLRDFGLD